MTESLDPGEPPPMTHEQRPGGWWRRRARWLRDNGDCSGCDLPDVDCGSHHGGHDCGNLDWGGCDVPDCGCDPGCSLLVLANAAVVLRSVPREPGSPRGLAGWLWRRVRAYQIHVSAHRPPVCPMTPTCSRYGLDALSRHGAVRGGWLTWQRIRRCRRPGAYDPVPERIRP